MPQEAGNMGAPHCKYLLRFVELIFILKGISKITRPPPAARHWRAAIMDRPTALTASENAKDRHGLLWQRFAIGHRSAPHGVLISGPVSSLRVAAERKHP